MLEKFVALKGIFVSDPPMDPKREAIRSKDRNRKTNIELENNIVCVVSY